MKVFNKTFLPESITYNGFLYKVDIEASAKWSQSPHCWEASDALYDKGLRPILVKVLSRNLKGRTDLHGKEYQPTNWVFTISPDQVRWKVVNIFKNSARTELIRKDLTKEEASRLTLSIPPTKFKSAHCFIQK